MENYENLILVGEGGYGRVYKATCKVSGECFALKIHKLGVIDACVRELSCLSALKNHPNVIRLHDCFLRDETVVTVMSFMPYTLHEIIFKKEHAENGLVPSIIPLSFMANVSIQIAEALAYMHGLNMVHRDLKPDNVLLAEDFTVKVADMGLTRHCNNEMSSCVTPEPYRAPELFAKDYCTAYTCAVDMWSLGVLMANTIEGRVVFRSRKHKKRRITTWEIITRTLCPRDHLHAIYEPWDPAVVMPNVMRCEDAKRVILRLLTYDHKDRLSAYKFLKDASWRSLAKLTLAERNVVTEYIKTSDQ